MQIEIEKANAHAAEFLRRIEEKATAMAVIGHGSYIRLDPESAKSIASLVRTYMDLTARLVTVCERQGDELAAASGILDRIANASVLDLLVFRTVLRRRGS